MEADGGCHSEIKNILLSTGPRSQEIRALFLLLAQISFMTFGKLYEASSFGTSLWRVTKRQRNAVIN